MFNDNVFDQWLDDKSRQIIVAMGEGKALSSEEMMVLVLKAQTNHFNHLDVDLREDMASLRKDLTQDMKDLREDLTQDMKSLREDLTQDMKSLREDMDKRFEQVDKRFEQVDKRFDMLIARMDRFMIWSFATTLTVGGIVIASVKFL